MAPPEAPLSEIMTAPVVSAEQDDLKDDLAELFVRYHFRMLPVVDTTDHLLGVVLYSDIMKGVTTRVRP